MANACPKCTYFYVRCKCDEILLEVENKRLKAFIQDWDGHDTTCGRNREGFEGCDESMFRCDCGYIEAKERALK